MNRKIEIDFKKIKVLIDNFNQLSEREFEIVTLLSNQLSSKEIAKQLCISSHTVDSHRRNIIAKLGVVDTRCLQFLKLNQ